VVAYGFIVNHLFAVKTGRNSVFFCCDTHILNRLYIMVPYMSFYGFKKNQNFTQNTCVFVYGFTVNRQFAAKTAQTSVFRGLVPHISDRLYIIFSYMSF
jgi:hypothetical protein